MSNTFKIFLGWLFLFALFSLLLIYSAQAQEGLIEHSIASGKDNASSKDLSSLFEKLGIHEKTRSANPCIDAEEYTRKWCSKRALQTITNKHPFESSERKFFEDVQKTDTPCEHIAMYIGRVCEQENFRKIMNHFAE